MKYETQRQPLFNTIRPDCPAFRFAKNIRPEPPTSRDLIGVKGAEGKGKLNVDDLGIEVEFTVRSFPAIHAESSSVRESRGRDSASS